MKRLIPVGVTVAVVVFGLWSLIQIGLYAGSTLYYEFEETSNVQDSIHTLHLYVDADWMRRFNPGYHPSSRLCEVNSGGTYKGVWLRICDAGNGIVY